MKNAAELLTDREITVMDYISRGFSAAETAARMHFAERTVANWRNGISEKLDARNQPNAVAICCWSGVFKESIVAEGFTVRLASSYQRALEDIAYGLTAEAAAEAYDLSPKTITHERARMRAIIGARTVSHAVRIGYELDLLPPPEDAF